MESTKPTENTAEYGNKSKPLLDEQTAIDFANWYRREDIPENAEKYFGFSDEDMLNYYLELI